LSNPEILGFERANVVSGKGIWLIHTQGGSMYRAFDSIVLAVGSVSRNELVDEVEAMVGEVYVIGDASRPRNTLFAIREGTEVGRKI
jgi:hypothetical protein